MPLRASRQMSSWEKKEGEKKRKGKRKERTKEKGKKKERKKRKEKKRKEKKRKEKKEKMTQCVFQGSGKGWKKKGRREKKCKGEKKKRNEKKNEERTKKEATAVYAGYWQTRRFLRFCFCLRFPFTTDSEAERPRAKGKVRERVRNGWSWKTGQSSDWQRKRTRNETKPLHIPLTRSLIWSQSFLFFLLVLLAARTFWLHSVIPQITSSPSGCGRQSRMRHDHTPQIIAARMKTVTKKK